MYKKDRCRVCLNFMSSHQFSISKTIKTDENEVLITDILSSLTNINIYEGDKKPCTICIVCICEARRAYNFKLKCEKNDAFLNEQLSINSAKDSIKEDVQQDEDIKSDFSDDNDFQQNNNNNVPKKNAFLCEQCGKNNNSKKDLLNHLMEIHLMKIPNKIKREYLCYVCGTILSSFSLLNDHMDTHTKLDTINCTISNGLCENKGSLKRHMLTDEGEKPRKRPQYDQEFIYSASFKNHIDNNLNDSLHECDKCGKRYNSVAQLINHRTEHKAHRCDKCGKEFGLSTSFWNHMCDRNEDHHSICNICGNVFTRFDDLRSHIMIHTGEKRYHCEICEKGFIYGHCLRTHMKTHQANVAQPKVKENKT